MQALRAASAIKQQQYRFRRDLIGLPHDEQAALIAEAIRDCPDFLRNTLAWGLLAMTRRPKATKKDHEQRMARWTAAARVGQTRRLGELTARQREDLARCVLGEVDDVEFEQDLIWGNAA
jgi:hypothetical protein